MILNNSGMNDLEKSCGGRIFLNKFRTLSIKEIDSSQKVSVVSLFKLGFNAFQALGQKN